MMRSGTVLSFALALTGMACAPAQATAPARASGETDRCAVSEWRFLFANDGHGNDLSGSRESLLAAVRRGSPLRVGWSEANAKEGWSVEEFSNVGFTNIMGKRDVVAQLDDALIQSNYVNASRAGLKNPVVEWHAIMSTDGRFEAVMVERESGRATRKLVQRTRMNWYAFGPSPSCDTRPVILRTEDHQNEQVEDQKFEAR
ncbi:hypothetical protein LZC95_11130 [Pendulispora brunnea]|uniref:Uncharacterized protein n=1 Tax=Pendulispora brunnea TaxID=2905690 RepID=A0ABZ2KM01_9BACT